MIGLRRRLLRLLPVLSALLATGAVTCDDEGPACGDLFVDWNEGCDDGNTLAGDGCDATCQLECGNGVLDPGEACDDGNRAPADGCDSSCVSECGNARLDGNEECEYTLTSGCGRDCRWEDHPADGDADGDSDGDGDVDLPEPGESVTLLGELSAASATWHRPTPTCDELAPSAESCPYDGRVLRNRTGVPLTLTVDVRALGSGGGTLGDGMLFLYAGAALPADRLACLASDDDGGEGLDPRITGYAASPGSATYLVVTTWAAGEDEAARGTYELHIAAE